MHQSTIQQQAYQLFTFDDVGELAWQLFLKLQKPTQEFDRLVALAKGGLNQARTLTDLLAIPALSTIQIGFYEGIGQTAKTPVITQDLPTTIRNERILLFDDVVDSGETLRLAFSYVQQHGATSITTAALVTKPWTTFKPDLAAVESQAWVIFPNEIRETISLLRTKWSAAGASRERCNEQLRQIGFSDEHIAAF